MKVTISKHDFNKVVSREFNKLVVESYSKKDYKTLRELYVLKTGDRTINEAGITDFIKSAYKGIKDRGIKQYSQDVWKGIKSIGLGKGTTLLAGEETFDIKKRQELLDTAKAKVESWFTKLPSNNPLVSEIKELYFSLDKAGFPNSEDRGTFDTQVSQIENVYKKVVDNFEKGPKGESEAAAANVLISVLRGIVIYFQDYKIYDQNIYLKEQNEPTAEVPGPDVEEPIGSAEGEGSKSAAAAYSKKLPAGLAIGGASLLAMGFAAKSKAFQDALLSMRDMSKATDPKKIADGLANYVVNQVDVNAGDGITQAINAMHGLKAGDPGFLGPNAPISELMKYKDDLETLKQALQNQAGGAPVLDKIINGEIPGATKLGEFFKGTISGKGGSLLAINKGSFARTASKQIYKYVAGEAAKPLDTVKNAVIGKLALMSAPVLTALGLSFLGGFVTSAGLRLKGSVSSRMNDLRQVVIAMPDVKVGGGTKPVPAPKTPVTPAGPEPTAEIPGPDTTGPEPTAEIPGPEIKPGSTLNTIYGPDGKPKPVEPPKPNRGPTVLIPGQSKKDVPALPGKPETPALPPGPGNALAVKEPDDLAVRKPNGKFGIEASADKYQLEISNDLTKAYMDFRPIIPQEKVIEILKLLGMEDEQIEKVLQDMQQVSPEENLKESRQLKKKKMYLLEDVKKIAQEYKDLQRMKKLAGLIRD